MSQAAHSNWNASSCAATSWWMPSRLVLMHEFERFDPSRFVAFDVAGNLLFAVPIGAERKPNNGTPAKRP